MARLIRDAMGFAESANKELTCETAFKLGQAAVAFQGKTILIGKDTRLSGDMLESAVAAGIMSMGGTALLGRHHPDARHRAAGARAALRRRHRHLGVAQPAGVQRHQAVRRARASSCRMRWRTRSRRIVAAGGASADELPDGDAVGVALPVDDACELYIAHAVSTVAGEGIDFAGLKVALDVGHGASCMTSAEALRRLGADVTVSINEDFDGTDINVQCGSTHLEPRCATLVAEIGADVGIAHDGDADRVMLVDAHGNEIDGDVVEAVCAIDLQRARAACRQHRRVHRHVQPRALACSARCGHRARSDEGGRPLRAGGHARGRLRLGRRAERPYDLPRAQLHRRRPGRRRCSSWPLASAPASPSRMSPAVMTRFPQTLDQRAA